MILLNQEVNRALMLPDVREKLAAFGLEVHTESPEYFSDVIRRDFEKWESSRATWASSPASAQDEPALSAPGRG